MIFDIAGALNYLHTEAFLMHADIKSHNILIKEEFAICKLCDFGVCLPLDKNGQVLPNHFYKGLCLFILL